ncbi:MlaD family protein [Nocardia wallacei]|uniref:MlaD family protein n=1 Tax=Nocardia wallacei TaxID=480035 RepID=UPI002457D176|nr:MlaD family protein [Nocardia wallacei]
MGVFVDHSGRSAGPWMLRLRGVVIAALIAVVAVVVAGYAQGRFTDRFRLTIDAATLGEGLAPGAEVKFHGLAIGRVRHVETVGYGHQRIELDLDRGQARVLTDAISARFTSSNVFGSSAIELVPTGHGAPLPENATLHIGENAQNATVAGMFRRAARLTQVLDSGTVRRLFDLLIDNSDALGSTVESFFETARMLATEQRAPLAHYLGIGAEVSGGAAELTPPVVEAILGILDQSVYFGEAANRARTDRSLDGVDAVLLRGVADLLARDNPELSRILGGVLDVAVPIGVSLGTVAPAYDRVHGLIGRVGEAFPVVDGRVQLQLEVIVKTMPYLVDSIAAPEPGVR